MPRAWLVGLALSASACGSHPNDPDGIEVLAGPSAETGFEYSDVYNVIELAGERIVFADGREKVVLAGHLEGQAFDTIGRGGRGPGEYQTPSFVYGVSGLEFVLVDIGLWRATKWTVEGHRRADWAIPPSRIMGIDSLGRMYACELLPRTDSLYLLRWALGEKTIDTIGRVKAAAFHRVDRPRGFQLIGVVYGYAPAFGVFRDGTVWIARDEPYHIDVMSPSGKWSGGPARAYTPIPVTARERRLVRDLWGRVGANEGPAPLFAEVKAPFMEGATDPSGTVWLRRYTPTDDSLPLYDLFDRTGHYLRAVRLPFGYRVAGVGAQGHVYAVRRDPDGLMQVARFQRPAGGR